ncbi:MAG: hypothetical protein K6T83_10080, partial [Alicyclobacillus sp.]|nr:hypothetical protein [Alicyclobacillus sp.]
MGLVIQGIVFAIVFVTAIYLFGSAIYQRYRFLKLAAPDPSRFDQPGRRLWSFVVNVLAQRKVLAEPSGLGHFFIFWGFLVLVFGDLDFIIFHLTRWHLPWATAPAYLFIEELFSWFVLVAIIIAFVRRYAIRPMRLDTSVEAGVILGLIFIIILTYFFATGADAARDGVTIGWASPIVWAIARGFAGLSGTALLAISEICFWLHVLAICTFLYLIPRSKHLHMIGAMANWYFRRYDSPGRLRKLDLEDESIEEFGVGQIQQFTWKQLLDGYACTECGRCHV